MLLKILSHRNDFDLWKVVGKSHDRLEILAWSCTDISLCYYFKELISGHCQVEKLSI